MICNNCGRNIIEGSKFCTKCGADVDNDISMKNIEQKRKIVQNAKEIKSKAKRYFMLVVVTIIALLIIPVGLIYYINTPNYALRVLNKAMIRHDSMLFLKHFNIDKIVENMLSEDGNSKKDINSELFDNIWGSVVDNMKVSFEEGISTFIEDKNRPKSHFRLVSVKKNGLIANVEIRNIDNNALIPLTMMKIDNVWQIVSIDLEQISDSLIDDIAQNGDNTHSDQNANAKHDPNKVSMNCKSPNFRKSCWGDTLEEVMEIEGIATVDSDDVYETIIYEDIAINGYKYAAAYRFYQDMLIETIYVLTDSFSNQNKYIDAFDAFVSSAKERYGEPNITENWDVDLFRNERQQWGLAVSMGHYQKYAFWDLTESEILATCDGNNYDINVIIDYSSKKHRNIIEKARKEKQKNIF